MRARGGMAGGMDRWWVGAGWVGGWMDGWVDGGGGWMFGWVGE